LVLASVGAAIPFQPAGLNLNVVGIRMPPILVAEAAPVPTEAVGVVIETPVIEQPPVVVPPPVYVPPVRPRKPDRN
jgi:hypothetical protein